MLFGKILTLSKNFQPPRCRDVTPNQKADNIEHTVCGIYDHGEIYGLLLGVLTGTQNITDVSMYGQKLQGTKAQQRPPGLHG